MAISTLLFLKTPYEWDNALLYCCGVVCEIDSLHLHSRCIHSCFLQRSPARYVPEVAQVPRNTWRVALLEGKPSLSYSK